MGTACIYMYTGETDLLITTMVEGYPAKLVFRSFTFTFPLRLLCGLSMF
jgi:hypothetical protein